MRKILIALLALFVLLFAAYTAYWHWQAGQAAERTRQWLDALNASAPAELDGRKILTAAAIETAGYPAALRVVLIDPEWNLPLLRPEDGAPANLSLLLHGKLDGELRFGTAAPLDRLDAALQGKLRQSMLLSGQEHMQMTARLDEPLACAVRFDTVGLAQRYSLDLQAMLGGILERPEELRGLECALPALEASDAQGELLMSGEGGTIDIAYEPDSDGMADLDVAARILPWQATPAMDAQMEAFAGALTDAGMPLYLAPMAPLGEQDFELKASLRGPAGMAEPTPEQGVEAVLEAFTARNALTAMQLTGQYRNLPHEDGKGRQYAAEWKYAGNFMPAYDLYARDSFAGSMRMLKMEMERALQANADKPALPAGSPFEALFKGDAGRLGDLLPEFSAASPITSSGDVAWTVLPSAQPDTMGDAMELAIRNAVLATRNWQLQLAAKGDMGGTRLLPEANATLVCRQCDAFMIAVQRYASNAASIYSPPKADGTQTHPVQSIAFWRDLRGLVDAVAAAHPETAGAIYHFQLILQGLAPTVNGLTADRLMQLYHERLQPHLG